MTFQIPLSKHPSIHSMNDLDHSGFEFVKALFFKTVGSRSTLWSGFLLVKTSKGTNQSLMSWDSGKKNGIFGWEWFIEFIIVVNIAKVSSLALETEAVLPFVITSACLVFLVVIFQT